MIASVMELLVLKKQENFQKAKEQNQRKRANLSVQSRLAQTKTYLKEELLNYLKYFEMELSI
jgi:hypothetical protein